MASFESEYCVASGCGSSVGNLDESYDCCQLQGPSSKLPAAELVFQHQQKTTCPLLMEEIEMHNISVFPTHKAEQQPH